MQIPNLRSVYEKMGPLAASLLALRIDQHYRFHFSKSADIWANSRYHAGGTRQKSALRKFGMPIGLWHESLHTCQRLTRQAPHRGSPDKALYNIGIRAGDFHFHFRRQSPGHALSIVILCHLATLGNFNFLASLKWPLRPSGYQGPKCAQRCASYTWQPTTPSTADNLPYWPTMIQDAYPFNPLAPMTSRRNFQAQPDSHCVSASSARCLAFLSRRTSPLQAPAAC